MCDIPDLLDTSFVFHTEKVDRWCHVSHVSRVTFPKIDFHEKSSTSQVVFIYY